MTTRKIVLLAAILTGLSNAQSSSQSSSASDPTSQTQTQSQPTFDVGSSLGSVRTITTGSVSVPTGSYTPIGSAQATITSSSASNGSNGTNATATSTTSNTLLLVGGSSTANATSTSSTTSAAPSNTQACNNYPELCNRQYMSFTEVCAHNSAFSRPNNAASNQQYDIIAQLNDGVRMIQGETHYVNDTIFSCHTSCDILNAGTLQSELSTVASWVQTHPYDVVTILLVNSDYRNVTDYVAPIQNSGLAPYLYTPPKVPMHRTDWPVLSDMILSGKRVVVFMDYMANQTEVPYVLDEFSQMWETPFSPQNISFPCTQQRPPGLNSQQQDLVPYLANHNLNLEISLGSSSILIPNFATLDQVNSVSGVGSNGTMGSLGAMAQDCNITWGRPPAWLLVDYYNQGNYPGDVFEVAAQMNGLNYTRASSCCGNNDNVSGAAVRGRREGSFVALVAVVIAGLFVGGYV